MRRFIFAATLLALTGPRYARPCAPAPPPGGVVHIASEEALIVWDAETRTQDFVRRANFESTSEAFGFLVPSPAVPELSEVKNSIFDSLQEAIMPERVVLTGLRVEPTALALVPFLMTLSARDAAPQKRGVQILKQQRVAGYDAVVLAADAPAALATWLKDHGFASRPELEVWLKPYIDKRWKLTAFKIAKDQKGKATLNTSAVRMRFKADEPFYPYREPEDQRGKSGPRSLRVFLIAKAPMKGALAGKMWPGELEYRAPKDLSKALGVRLPGAKLRGTWLHAWMDYSAPRPGVDDVFFAAEPGAKPLKPPPYEVDKRTTVPIPLDVILGIFVFVWWRRRKR